MSKTMTHARCSELLGDFARGALAPEEAALVRAHLDACPDCSRELVGVRALLPREGDELTEHERARLTRGIKWQVPEIDAPRRRSPWSARVATALGAAALLAIVGVALVQGKRDNAATGGGGNASGAGKAPAESHDDSIRNAPAAAAAPRPVPTFQRHAGVLTNAKLDAIGKHDQFTGFRNSYSAPDAHELQPTYTSALAAQAPENASDRVRSCAETVYANTQSYSLLPAYAADGRIDGHKALVLGFAWTDKASGPLDQYMFWVFPTSSCDSPLDYRTGQIGPQK